MAGGPRKERGAREFTDRTLNRVVQGKSRAARPSEALKELVRRDAVSAPRLGDMVADEGRDPELRVAAAVALGRERSGAGELALAKALEDAEPTVLRRAAEALGKIGDEAALSRLESVSASSEPARRSVDFAQALISYRLGLNSHLLDSPAHGAGAEIDPRTAEALEPAPIPARALGEILADASEQLPAIALAEQGAVQFSCEGRPFALLLSQDLVGRDSLQFLVQSNAVAGVLLERSPTSTDYFLAEYLLADPGSGGASARILGVRPTGVVVHAGRVDPSSGAFELRTVDTGLSPPAEVRGVYDPAARSLRITDMLVQRDFVRPPRASAEPQEVEPSDL
jgi:hypothetical protein